MVIVTGQHDPGSRHAVNEFRPFRVFQTALAVLVELALQLLRPDIGRRSDPLPPGCLALGIGRIIHPHRLQERELILLIDSMTTTGIVLAGDNTRFHLTNEQKGFLWQMLTGSKSTKNNPYSVRGGEKWLEIKEEMEEKKEE